ANNVSGGVVLPNPWTWTLTVSNGGNAAANFSSGQTILTDSLPGTNVTYGAASVVNPTGITGTINCSIASNTLTCTASGAVSIAAPGSFQAQFTATPSAVGTFTNPTGGSCRVDPGNVVTESNEANNDCNSDSVTVTAPDLTATKTNNAGGSVVFPNPWTWNIHVANGGNAAANFATAQVILTDNLPNSGISYGAPSVANPVGVNSANISCSIVSSNLTCTASGAVTMAAAGAFDVRFTPTPTAAGTFSNPRVAGVCAVDPNNYVTESNESNNACSDTVNTIAADLQLSKAITAGVSGGMANTGTNVTYTITVVNNGPSPANSVTVPDLLPANVTLVSCTPSVGSCTGTTATLGTLANMASATVTIVAQVNCSVADGTVIGANSTSVSSSTPDPIPGNNNASSATF